MNERAWAQRIAPLDLLVPPRPLLEALLALASAGQSTPLSSPPGSAGGGAAEAWNGEIAGTLQSLEHEVTQCERPMTDLVYIGITVCFFVAGGLYVGLCERL